MIPVSKAHGFWTTTTVVRSRSAQVFGRWGLHPTRLLQNAIQTWSAGVRGKVLNVCQPIHIHIPPPPFLDAMLCLAHAPALAHNQNLPPTINQPRLAIDWAQSEHI
ncbi:hypothetical protein Bbelb_178990 [Branchiostoma belcheri]|nr:hypothetical protein Bbelb_178990 [Branchiostoma belcheri]